MPLEPGQTILNGKYRIIRALGEGAFGHVYLADDTVMGQHVAIKELRRAELTAEQYQEHLARFRREALIGRSLQQQTHIVKVYTLERSGDDDYYLIMEYVDGESLQARIQREGRLPVADAVNIAVQLCDALMEVHRHPLGIVHRDIKPSNILLTRDGTAKLADFGLAQLAQESGRSLGAGGAHPGSPLYKSPEQETTTRYLDPASDIYSLGLVIAEMLVGQPYKPLCRRNQTVGALCQVPAWLDQIIARAVAEDLKNRYGDAADLKNDLLQRRVAGTGPQAAVQERVAVRAEPTQTCPQCGASASVSANTCPRCGGTFVIESLSIVQRVEPPTAQRYADFYRERVRTNPRAEYYQALGLCYLRLELYDLAVEALEKAVRQAPEMASAYYYLALASLKGRRPKLLTLPQARRIEQYLQAAANLRGDQAHIYYLWALLKHDFYVANGMLVRPPTHEQLLARAEACALDRPEVVGMLAHVPVRDGPVAVSIGRRW